MHWAVNVVVEYQHCHETTKMAYHAKFLDANHPGWTHLVMTHVWVSQLARTWMYLFREGGMPPRSRKTWLWYVRKRTEHVYKTLQAWKPESDGLSEQVERQ